MVLQFGCELVSDEHWMESQMTFFFYEQQINRELKGIHICQYVGIGTMKDENLKLMDLHVSYTLGCAGNWNT